MKIGGLRRGRGGINTSRAAALGFAALILLGALLLKLPFASREPSQVGFFDALFTSTSAVCVTGLIVYDTAVCWTLFGQAVIITLIQIGGLGFMTVISGVFFAVNKNMGMRGRMVLAEGMSADNMGGILLMARHILAMTMTAEGAGAVILSACFIPRFGLARGIWYGVFHSISAFCNAGFDLMGSVEAGAGMTAVNTNPAVLLTLCALIVCGGLGFFTWEDIFAVIRRKRRRLRLQTKLVLIVSAALILLGAAAFLAYEYNGAFAGMSAGDKLVNALFQSITPRTAGFAAVEQSSLCPQSKLITMIFMLIGGSSGSTAGGFKTATLAVAAAASVQALIGREDVVIFSRTVGRRQVMYAFALILMSAALTLLGAMIISADSAVPLSDALYETASAYGTAGLSVGVTAVCGTLSRWILLVYMFFGRVGIMTVALAAVSRGSGDSLKYPKETLMIG